MEWKEARDQTLAQWQRVLDGIGRRDPMTIVAELNELSALCEQARKDAGSASERCAHCLAFDDASECLDARWRVTESLLDGELEEARAAAMRIFERIAAARPPVA